MGSSQDRCHLIAVKLARGIDDWWQWSEFVLICAEKLLKKIPWNDISSESPRWCVIDERPQWHITVQRNKVNHIDERIKGLKLNDREWKGFNACEKYKASWLPPKIETNVQDKGRLGGPVFGFAFVLSRGCASPLSAFNHLVSPISICPFPFVHSLFVGLIHIITPPSPNADKCGGIENSCDPWNLTRVMTWWPDRLNDPSPQSTKDYDYELVVNIFFRYIGG